MNPYSQNDPHNPYAQGPLNPSNNHNPNLQSNPNLPPQYPQQYPLPSYYPHLNQQVYLPPNQYGNHGINEQIFDRKSEQSKKIKDLEAKLDNGWGFFYISWLFVKLISSTVSFGYSSIILVFTGVAGGTGMTQIRVAIIIFPFSFWILQYCSVMLKAINKRSSKRAKRGLFSMKGFAIFYLICFFISMFIAVREGLRLFYIQNILYITGWLVFAYVLPMMINIKGAQFVSRVLAERDALLQTDNSNVA